VLRWFFNKVLFNNVLQESALADEAGAFATVSAVDKAQCQQARPAWALQLNRRHHLQQ
jgi:hypothetical protein